MPRFRIDVTDTAPEIPGWAPVNLTPAPPDDPTREARLVAERSVADLLQCDHVVVLAGLGTSLCIKDPADEGKSLFPTMGVLWDAASTKVGQDVFERVQKDVGFAEGRNIEALLSRCQMKLGLSTKLSTEEPIVGSASTTNASPDIKKFVEQVEEVIYNECRKDLAADATQVHEDFLRRLVRRAPRRPRANLFTTNYDVCFETAAARIGLPVIDGFAFSLPPRFYPEVFDYDIVTTSSYSKEPDFVPRLIRLFKLHGSVDWHLENGAIIKKLDTTSPVLVYPREGKYAASYSQPFLEIMSRLQGLLRQRNVGLLSICCGFNDLHIAEPVLSAVKANPSLRIVVCAPDLCAKDAQDLSGNLSTRGATQANQVLYQFDHLIGSGDSRITLINGFFPDLVRLMPTMVAQTDAEQHEARIKKLEADMARIKDASGSVL